MTRELKLRRLLTNAGIDTLLFLDFETFYKTKATKKSKSFSLKGKTYWEYIFDKRFHTTGLGFAMNNDEFDYINDPEEISDLMEEIKERRGNGERIGVVAHNTQFDASIMAWIFGVKFDYYFCTQLMAKQNQPTLSTSLSNVAKRVWANDDSMRKGTELVSFDGVEYCDFSESDHQTMSRYCIQDCHIMRELFYYFTSRGIVEGETQAMNITLRACVEPQFRIKYSLLEEVIEDQSLEIARAVTDAIKFCNEASIIEVSPATFSSNPKYANLLERFGADIETKISPTTFRIMPALGKNDPEYIKTQINNPKLAPLFKAREKVKSTISLSRATKMLQVATLFRDKCPGVANMPMFLNYYGALNTGRWSGGQKLNQQNLPRGSKHRRSLCAQEGYRIAVNDLSNIELRVNLWFCEQEELLHKYKVDKKFDMYSDLASDMLGVTVTKETHPQERQMGKAACLGLGYAMSWYGFQQYLASGPLGMDPQLVSDDFAKNIKRTYEIKHYMVKQMWNQIQNYVLPVLEIGGNYRFGRGNCCMAMKGKIYLPSKRVLHYPNTTSELVEKEWGMARQFSCDGAIRNRFGEPTRRSLHKGLIIENIIQALARDILTWQVNNIDTYLKKTGFGWVIGSVHDEVLVMSQEKKVEYVFSTMQQYMAQVPKWAAKLPLDSEGGYAVDYSK